MCFHADVEDVEDVFEVEIVLSVGLNEPGHSMSKFFKKYHSSGMGSVEANAGGRV